MSDLTIGVDLGGTKMLMLAERAGERLVEQVATGSNFTGQGFQAALGGFISELGETPRYVGVAIPGLVGADQRIVACDVLPLLEGLGPQELAALPCPVAFVNDVEAALVEEGGELPAESTLAVIMVGTGIGMAFKGPAGVWRGAHGWAGELGSIPVALRDQVLTLDAAASGASIMARAGGDAEALKRQLEQQEPAALELVRSAGFALGLGLATVINLLNPGLLCLGGGTLSLPGYQDSALESAQRYCLPDLWRGCAIRPPRAGGQVAALGALRFAGETFR